MRVLLLTSNTNNSENPPLGLYLLKAYTEKYREDRDITIDVHAFISFNFVKILKFILKYKPDVLGFGCYVWNCKAFQEMCKKVKEIMPNITIIMGGPSITKNDLELDELLEQNIVKYMIVGEGERIFNEIILNIYDKTEEKNNQLPNCMGKDEEGRIFKRSYEKEWRCDINTLPNPFFIYKEFREAALNYGCVTIETSRGCPYNCSYCVESQIPFYSKDISVVLEELEYLHILGVKNIVVLDATLNFDIKRTKDLFTEIVKKGWKFDFSFELKAECLDNDLMYLLTQIGVRKIEIGLQSSNKSTLKRISRHFNEDKFVGNIKKLIELKIDIVVDLIAGLPNESLENWLESIDYCYRLGDVNISSNLLKMLPGTDIYNEIDKYQYKYNPYNMNEIQETNTMTVEDIEIIKKVTTVLNCFWSFEDKQWKQKMRKICDTYFDGKFSKLLMNIATFILNRGITQKDISESILFKEKILNELLNDPMKGDKLCLK